MSSVLGRQAPPTSDARWVTLVTVGPSKPLKALALKIILKRVTGQCALDGSRANIKRQIEELADFFSKNARMLDADIASLFD